MTSFRPMVDTNILVYAHNRDSLYHRQAVSILRDLIKMGGFCVSSLILLEFFSVITNGRKVDFPMATETALTIIDDMLHSQRIDVLPTYIDTGFLAWLTNVGRSVKRYQIYDAAIAYTMHQNHVSVLYTNNTKDFQKFEFIQIINPFASSDEHTAPITSPMIPYGRQTITEQDIAAVCRALRSDWLTQGPEVPAFEKAVSAYCGANYAVAVNSGTAALHLACLSLGVGPGDMVWTSPITFVASANCARYCGADFDFVDIDPRTYNMSPSHLEEKLKYARANGRLPKVVIPVHLTGQSCDMEAIHQLSQAYGFRIIEDACHALGGRYQGEPIGNCRFSDITVFSFHPVKTITTGEGGMALTNNPELAARMTLLRTHGITREGTQMQFQETNISPPAWYYEQIALGLNYRMTDIQAALGSSQLRRLDEFVRKRHALARRYNELLANLPITRPWQHPDAYSGFHLYVIRLKLDRIRKTHRQVFDAMRSAGIGVHLHYIPVYRHPDFARIAFNSWHDFSQYKSSVVCHLTTALFPEAESYYAEAITLPIFPTMTDGDVNHIVEELEKILLQRKNY